jgi:polyisoprenoid-binding protein YceI
VVGDLTLAGVTKPVTLDVDGPVAPQKGQQGGLVSGFSATGLLKRSDFNFGQKYLPPFIGDEVKLTLDVEIGQK